ncbi:hypothetical protein NDU88_003639 [Pleurodeles waltl]|uniref:Transmembrane protein n=1 Tax=Pleurodeles waltl TaxID=8319 RepID=A0AAV7MR52_PLEWA|nr:hypothetical protein NDU88_003639 [Pleurodeles waltl]
MAQDRVQDCQETPVSRICSCATKCCRWILFLISMVWIGLSIAEIVIGSVYLDECPRQRYIPIYLIVNGVVMIVMTLLSIVDGIRPNICIHVLLSLLGIFWFCWLIAGSVWTFRIYPNYDNCNRTVYLFAFSVLIIQWIALAFMLPVVILKLCTSLSACASCLSCFSCSSCNACSVCSRCASLCCCGTKG